jgi:hypothetical protein
MDDLTLVLGCGQRLGKLRSRKRGPHIVSRSVPNHVPDLKGGRGCHPLDWPRSSGTLHLEIFTAQWCAVAGDAELWLGA